MEKLEFQLYDWLEGHDNNEEDEEEEDNSSIGNFIIHTFGRCEDGKSVYCKIINFTPYFYILIPSKLQSKSKFELNEIVKKMEIYFKSDNNKKVYYKYKKTLKELQLVQMKKAEGFTNNKEFWFVRLVFSNADGMKKYKSYFENNNISIYNIKELSDPIKYRLYEANLPPMFRCFHIREISGCSWVETKIYTIPEDNKSRCDIEIIVDWRNLNPIKKDTNAPFRIASFDIECNSIDGEFPQASRRGDSIIQIGITYTYLGQSTPYRQYIVCLKKTDDFDKNVIVESCDNEEDMMLKFLDELNSNDCDIITGYNIFYFDEKYMYDRAEKILGISNTMSRMSKLTNYECKFREMKLASSALGENLLRFWETPGRVHIDLMKEVQKTFNLPSYKLDFVSSKFIRGEVLSYNTLDNNMFELNCKIVEDINADDYIHLEVVKGFVTDEVGEKYNIIKTDYANKKIIVQGNQDLAKDLDSAKMGGTIYWSQAKDDIGPKDIFRLQKGNSKDRAIVAKYCIKDCKLVNLLINKLQIVTNNIEMANVCSVPLSYLFIRGQGIKIFSLCMKEFRKFKYVFPVLKMNKYYECMECHFEFINSFDCPKCKSKKKREIEQESSSYEGAIVFDPVPKVDYEALATKDYMSLYPSAIIQKNMSHETIIEDDEYDNLEGITYFNAEYREADGTIQYRRYAKIDNKLGVIPTILDNLLKERKIIKKQMNNENDPFKKKILDAKQLAVKITANSLYGQLGATTSPVCKRDIAACTTSTGREMLIFARKYDEECLPWLINSFKHYYSIGDIDKINYLYDKELKNKSDNTIQEIKDFVTKDIINLTFQPVIRYGDSVIGKTPLLLRCAKTKRIIISSIEELVEDTEYKIMHNRNSNVFTFDNKEYCDLNNLESWTEKGWTKIDRVIRHRLIKKKLFRISTNSGSVVVTEDHSLLTNKGKEISPKNLKIGDLLLHSFPKLNTISTYYDNYEYDDSNINIIDNDYEAMIYYYKYVEIYKKTIDIKYINGKYYFTPYKNHISSFDNHNSRIISIEEHTDYEEYVYDLTTENHHFHAGVGSIIVHNTDSIFSCYRFRENVKLVDDNISINLWKKIVKFSKTLIEPFMNDNTKEIFNKLFTTHYGNINELIIPNTINYMNISKTNNKIILPLEDRVTQFTKEYIMESYIPWLWTLSELVEKNYINTFENKLFKWAEHLLSKYRLNYNNLYDMRKNYIMDYINNYMKKIYQNNYYLPSEEQINNFVQKLNNSNPDSFPFSSEIKIEEKKLLTLVRNLMEKTIKEKWIYSSMKKELTKLIKEYLGNVVDGDISNYYIISNYLINYLSENKNLDINKSSEILIKNLLNDTSMGVKFNDKINIYTMDFIENYNKNNGKKSLEEIMEDFVEKDLGLSFNKLKDDLTTKVIDFINYNMRYLDMSTMDTPNKYIYYWIQPVWLFDNGGTDNYNKIYSIKIYEDGTSITDHRTLDYSMKIGKLSGELIKSRLPFPHVLEYEKTFWPFAILTKKRYVGNKYEFDPKKYKQDFMGIVLKRRDNAPIVKEICGGIIDYLINKRSPEGAKEFTKKCIQDMFDGKYDIKYFLQSRTLKLKESYKDWKKIAHVYLSDKISQRDPGNTPQSGDRIEFAVIKVPVPANGVKILQGDMIETPKYIKENNLEIDYLFYLTNQIMNPALQFLEIVDKDAIMIFKDFINMYSTPKIKVIKEKVIKEKVVKEKVVKEKVVKEKVVKEKVGKKKSNLQSNLQSSLRSSKSILDNLMDIKNKEMNLNNIMQDKILYKSKIKYLLEDTINKLKSMDVSEIYKVENNLLNIISNYQPY
jgi:DNA polymerase elongation subunit (family B)